MNEKQQELYEKLLKKVNEYCLGYAAEDVIAAIDDLVDTYENKINEITDVANWHSKERYKYKKAVEIFERNCLLSQYPDGTYELAFTNKIQPRDEDVKILKEVLK